MSGEAILTARCDDPPARVRENVAAAYADPVDDGMHVMAEGDGSAP
jgi:hypothetical protein